jgi:thiosulfate dehydrogenase [quinone] large subunit
MNSGDAVRVFWEQAVIVPQPPAQPAASFGWYRTLLRRLLATDAHRWLGPLLAILQVATGVGLLLGRPLRGSALVGLLQNLGFSLAGGRGHNPLMLVAQTILLLRGGRRNGRR